MIESKALGKLIRHFRKRYGISQMNLEVDIDASAGSMSRIESGVNNPTKETLLKIAKRLELNADETASLFGISMNSNDNELNECNYALPHLNVSSALPEIIEIVEKEILEPAIIFISYILIKSIDPEVLKPIYIKSAPARGFSNSSLGEMSASLSSDIAPSTFCHPFKVSDKSLVFKTPHIKFEVIPSDLHSLFFPLFSFGKIIGFVVYSSTKADALNIKSVKRAQSILKDVIVYKNIVSNTAPINNFWTNLTALISKYKLSSIFIAFYTIYWILSQLLLPEGGIGRDIFGYTYGFVLLVGIGYIARNNFLSNSPNTKPMAIILMLSFLLQEIGQLSYVALIIQGIAIPYPFYGDIPFLVSITMLLILLVVLYSKELKQIPIKRISLATVVSYIIFYFSVYARYNDTNYTLMGTVFDLIFTIIDGLSIAISATLLCVGLGTNAMRPLRLSSTCFLLGILLLGVSDLMFLIQAYDLSWIISGVNDFTYFLSYALLTFGIDAINKTPNFVALLNQNFGNGIIAKVSEIKCSFLAKLNYLSQKRI